MDEVRLWGGGTIRRTFFFLPFRSDMAVILSGGVLVVKVLRIERLGGQSGDGCGTR